MKNCLSCLCVFAKPSPPAPLPKGEGRNLQKSSNMMDHENVLMTVTKGDVQ